MQKPQISQLRRALLNQEHSLEEAKEIEHELQERTMEGEDPEEVLLEFGLEADYVFDIIDACI